MHLTPYIDDPIVQVTTVIQAAIGNVPTVDGIHAGLGIADYAALKLMDTHVVAAKPMTAMDDKAIGAELEKATKQDVVGAGEAKAFPWPVVMPFILELLKRWLKL